MNIKKVVAVLAVGSLAAMGLSACGGSGASGSNSIEVMTNMDTDSPELKALTKLTEQFEKENEGVEIKLTPRTSSYEQDIKVRLAGKNAPDIFSTHGWSRDRYANFLEPLSSESWVEHLTDTAKSAMMTDDGDIYALPIDMSSTGMIYNRTLLKKAGVDEKSIKTWDDFDAACQKIKNVGATCIGSPGKDNWWSGNIADYVATGVYEDDELQALLDGDFQVDAYAKDTSLIEDWAKSGYFNPDYSSAQTADLYRLMAQDNMAFAFQTNTFTGSVESYNPEVDLGVMPLPSSVSDPYFVGGENQAYGIAKNGKHKELCLKYINFLAEPKNMVQLTKAMGTASAFDNVEANMGKVSETYDYWTNEVKVETKPIFDRTYLPNGMWNTMITTADGVINGQLTAKQASEQMKAQFDTLYGQDEK